MAQLTIRYVLSPCLRTGCRPSPLGAIGPKPRFFVFFGFIVMPVQTGIQQVTCTALPDWIPACAGMTAV
jgi:hypothetical protein